MNERENKDKYLDLTREQKKLWNMKMTVISIVIRTRCAVNKSLVQGLEDLEIRGQEYSNVEIRQHIEKSPGNLRRLTVTQIPLRNHQLVLG